MRVSTFVSFNHPEGQSGFGIVDSLIALAIMSVFLMYFGLNFLSKREQIALVEARIQFDSLVAKVLVSTEANTTCEKLNIINSSYRIGKVMGVTLQSLPVLTLGGIELAKIGVQGKVRLTKIELVQTSLPFGVLPKRAKAQIRLSAEYLDRNGKIIKNVSNADLIGIVEIMIEGHDDNIVRSCYGRYSERIKCLDMNGKYNPDRIPNCKI